MGDPKEKEAVTLETTTEKELTGEERAILEDFTTWMRIPESCTGQIIADFEADR